MITFKVLLKKHQPKTDGTFPILIRIIANRESKLLSTGFAVNINQFTDIPGKWITKHPEAKFINAEIELQRRAIQEAIDHAARLNVPFEVKSLTVNKINSPMFIKLLEAQRDKLKDKSQTGLKDKLNSHINNLKAAWISDVAVVKLNKIWVDQYINYQLQKKVSPNTIKDDLSAFSGILDNVESYHHGRNWFREAQTSIRRMPIDRETLTPHEILLIDTGTLPAQYELARDIFLFSYYAGGMSFLDIALFEIKQIEKGNIRYVKSLNKKIVELQIQPKLQSIVDKYYNESNFYLFPLLKENDTKPVSTAASTANALINVHLKFVSKFCRINKKITTNTAKYSFERNSIPTNKMINDVVNAIYNKPK